MAVGGLGIGALVLTAGCEPLALTAMNMVELTEFTVDGPTLYMSGEINSKTETQFAELIAANPQITTLVECEVPGSIDDDTMIALSYRVRELGLDTHLTSESEVASGGVDLFLAGVKRSMQAGARLGVHSWSDGTRDAADYPRDAPEHDANRRYIEDMLGDDAFYWFTIYAAPAEDIHWMTRTEIAEYAVLTEPVTLDQRGYQCPRAG